MGLFTKLAENNAKIEGVDNRVQFIRASASELPFESNSFDIVLSSLTFHEVKDEDDKLKVLQEALRVLKADGKFVFMDLFLNEVTFGDINKLAQQLPISEFVITKLDSEIQLPKVLQSKKSLGDAAFLTGVK